MDQVTKKTQLLCFITFSPSLEICAADPIFSNTWIMRTHGTLDQTFSTARVQRVPFALLRAAITTTKR